MAKNVLILAKTCLHGKHKILYGFEVTTGDVPAATETYAPITTHPTKRSTWYDASDSDWETEWRGGVASDPATDEEDEECRLERDYYSDASGILEEYWSED